MCIRDRQSTWDRSRHNVSKMRILESQDEEQCAPFEKQRYTSEMLANSIALFFFSAMLFMVVKRLMFIRAKLDIDRLRIVRLRQIYRWFAASLTAKLLTILTLTGWYLRYADDFQNPEEEVLIKPRRYYRIIKDFYSYFPLAFLAIMLTILCFTMYESYLLFRFGEEQTDTIQKTQSVMRIFIGLFLILFIARSIFLCVSMARVITAQDIDDAHRKVAVFDSVLWVSVCFVITWFGSKSIHQMREVSLFTTLSCQTKIVRLYARFLRCSIIQFPFFLGTELVCFMLRICIQGYGIWMHGDASIARVISASTHNHTSRIDWMVQAI
eukprot:TRINITY_DN9364_c0_g2_i6.p1 TRINITY_DN9364_c0_g2~~TRINITY_DN9364_c0_g2_i6.p1  ORF type:complete len:345 (-),score=20.63 TRINITY_DN9364_c0_g2_i6:271-1245(-)